MIKNVFFCIEFFIDSAGFVHFLGRDLTITSFQAYEIRVSHFYQLKQQNFLFTVGVSFLTYLSIWNLCIKSNQVFFNFDKIHKSKWQMCTNPRGGYSGFQMTGMTEGFFWVWNFWLRDFFGYENLASIFLGSLTWVGIFLGY